MEVLGAILLVELVIAVLVALGVRRYGKADPQQTDGILAGEAMATIATVRSVEPVQIRHFRRTCNCKNVGCTL